MALERLNPRGVAQPSGPYVHAVRADKLVFISGQIATGPDGRIVGKGDAEAQAVQTLENLGASLRAVGADFSHVAKVTIYLRDMSQRAIVGAVRERYFKDAKPASTLVEVSALVDPELLIEVEAIAVLPD